MHSSWPGEQTDRPATDAVQCWESGEWQKWGAKSLMTSLQVMERALLFAVENGKHEKVLLFLLLFIYIYLLCWGLNLGP
jgi:hypothetical protein